MCLTEAICLLSLAGPLIPKFLVPTLAHPIQKGAVNTEVVLAFFDYPVANGRAQKRPSAFKTHPEIFRPEKLSEFPENFASPSRNGLLPCGDMSINDASNGILPAGSPIAKFWNFLDRVLGDLGQGTQVLALNPQPMYSAIAGDSIDGDKKAMLGVTNSLPKKRNEYAESSVKTMYDFG